MHSRPMPCFVPRLASLAILFTLVACAGSTPTAIGLQRAARLQLKENVSTQKDAVALLGKPDETLAMPRAVVQRSIRAKCMQWDQRALNALFYFDEYLDQAGGKVWQQETQVYLTPDDRVCSWGVWTWPKGTRYQERFLPNG